MIILRLLCFILSIQDEIPLKPKEEFEVKLNYSFKQRSPEERNTFRYESDEKNINNQNTTSMLPYLLLKVTILKASPDEVKLKVVNNLSTKVVSKKVQEGVTFEIDMGFTDDVKDRVTPHEYTIFFHDQKQTRLSKILISVNEDGLFLINNEVRGKL